MVAAVTAQALASILTPTDSLAADARGELLIEGCSARSLLAAFGSPLYVVSERTLRANFRRLRHAFEARWPAPVNVLYAIKANNNLAIRAILNEEGAGGDCFGESELYATFAGGADPERVVMSGPNKSYADLRRAVELGIRVNVDAEDEIAFLAAISRELGREARVLLRAKVLPPELDDYAMEYGPSDQSPVEHLVSCQWGFSVDAVARLVPRVQATPGLRLEGYHLHVGRTNRDPGFYAAWAAALGEAVVSLQKRTGFAPTILDVGGGFARQRDPESRTLALNPYGIEDYADAVCPALLGSLRRGGLPTPALWLEPGRYIVGNAVLLLGTVGAVKHDLGRTWVNADFSINNLMRVETAGSRYHVLAANRLREPCDQIVDVVGPLCTGRPIAAAYPLPRLVRGDLLAVLDAGMYAETASTQLLGVPRPATVLVSAASAELIKERETVADVFAKHRIPARLRANGAATAA